MSFEGTLNERLLSNEESQLIYWSLNNGLVRLAIFNAPDVVDEAAHRAGAIGLLEIEERRYMESPQQLKSPRAANLVRGRWMPEKAVGERIPITTFIGPCFDVETWTYTPEVPYAPLYGFADALDVQVYARDYQVEVADLLQRFGRVLFNEFVDIEIYEWSTDWSDYFDAGNKYQGAFCWTVHNPALGTLIGIAAGGAY